MYALHIPHKVAGVFGFYLGYPLAMSKRCARECIEEFDKITDLSQVDYVSKALFTKGTVLRQQLELFGYSPDDQTPLHFLGELFLEIREKAFCSVVERYTEAEHKKTKAATQRGLRTCKPATTCARMRHPQVATSLAIPEEREWMIRNWNSRTIFKDLLAHKLTAAQVDRLTLAQRHARVYGYDSNDHYEELAAEQKAVGVLTALQDVVQVTHAVERTTSITTIQAFLKNRLCTTGVYSVPTDLFELVLRPVLTDAPDAVTDAEFAAAVTFRHVVWVRWPMGEVGGGIQTKSIFVLSFGVANKSTMRTIK